MYKKPGIKGSPTPWYYKHFIFPDFMPKIFIGWETLQQQIDWVEKADAEIRVWMKYMFWRSMKDW